MKYLYFIKPVGMDGPIKIGCSKEPEHRLQGLAYWSPVPLEIMAFVPGSFDLERNVHQCFADAHSHKEWFHAIPRLVAAIAAIKAGMPVSEAIDLKDRRGKIVHRPSGGGAWSPAIRSYMSLLTKVRFAVLRAEKVVTNARLHRPKDIDVLIEKVRAGHQLTVEDQASIDDFLANPAPRCEIFQLRRAA